MRVSWRLDVKTYDGLRPRFRAKLGNPSWWGCLLNLKKLLCSSNFCVVNYSQAHVLLLLRQESGVYKLKGDTLRETGACLFIGQSIECFLSVQWECWIYAPISPQSHGCIATCVGWRIQGLHIDKRNRYLVWLHKAVLWRTNSTWQVLTHMVYRKPNIIYWYNNTHTNMLFKTFSTSSFYLGYITFHLPRHPY